MPREDTQFKPGQVANPKGRPKKENCLTDILKAKGNDKDQKNRLADKMWEMALDGDVPLMKYLYDRIDGRPKETIEQTIKSMPEVIEVDLSEDNTAAEDQKPLEE